MAKKYSILKTGETTVISKTSLKNHFESHFAARDLELPDELKHRRSSPIFVTSKLTSMKTNLVMKKSRKFFAPSRTIGVQGQTR